MLAAITESTVQTGRRPGESHARGFHHCACQGSQALPMLETLIAASVQRFPPGMEAKRSGTERRGANGKGDETGVQCCKMGIWISV